MKVSARVDNAFRKHALTLTTNDRTHELPIAPRADGVGSNANGGELLCLALATCYCNDVYREAKKRGIEVQRNEVEVEGTFGAEGAAAERFAYHVRIPVISAAQSGGKSATRSGVSRPERSDAGRSVTSHTRAAVSSLPGSSAATRRSA